MNKDANYIIGIVIMIMAFLTGMICTVLDNRLDNIDHKLNILTETDNCYEIEGLGTIVCKKGEAKNEQ